MTKVTAAIVLLIAGLLSGCFFGLGKDDGAEKVKDTVATMPGVTRAGFSTNDDGLATVTLPNLYVMMRTATPQQIRTVLDTIKNSPHENLDTVDITVSEKPKISVKGTVADIDASQFVDDVERLRQLAPAVGPTAVIEWTRDEMPEGDLHVTVGSPVAATLATIRETLGQIGRAEISPGPSSRVWDWKINFPFPPDQERHVNAQLESVPGQIGSVTVDSGVITELSVPVTSSLTAESQLSNIIAALDAGPGSPLMLSWHVGQLSAGRPDGTVHVGACGYPSAPHGDNLSPEDKALQERVREQYDTCPR
ncbi:hypothetical protein A5792_16530 [Mycolicibacterium peregrinum]|uniref:Uncharacterized protein n=1 Tax=Mycolicibacterium peregrinum TaxID=43304 RepID=A0A1A0RA60_MYCPR|nr:hypothetical protein [Mycolicibacterium peregrinum]OBB31003.1 hypothetical protein A5792_16530 [Mycolicibacterium peregrinum]